MGNKWTWIGVGLVGLGVFWGVGYFVSPAGGDQEFKNTVEALKQVKTFRGTYIAAGAQHTESLWEVDCNRGIVHKQSHNAGGDSALAVTQDELLVGSDKIFDRDSNGSWEGREYKAKLYSASWYCDNLAQATVRDLLPDVRGMLRSSMIGKADKKTVNGVRCQQWKFVKSSASGVQGLLCIGLDDHLPYEMIMDGGVYSYSDYNRPVQIDVPEGVLQSASASDPN